MYHQNLLVAVGVLSSVALGADSGNLLQNPRIEEFKNGVPLAWQCRPLKAQRNGTRAEVQGEAKNHQLCLKKVNDGQNAFTAWFQTVAVQPDTEYQLTATVEGTGRLFWYEYDKNHRHIGQIRGVSFFKRARGPITTGAKTSPQTRFCRVRFEIFGAKREGVGYADDFYFGLPRKSEVPLTLDANGVRSDWKEQPFVETRKLPEFTAQEQRRGMLIFQRPITEPVYPQTRPAPHERVAELRSFAARNQVATLTFTLFPVRELTGFSAQVKYPFASGGEFRQVSYSNNRYPHWKSRGVYRRTPGYMIPVVKQKVKAHEPQRFVINVPIPRNAQADWHRGQVVLTHAGLTEPVVLPYAIRVLPFELSRDPHKFFSAYSFNVRQLKQWRHKLGDRAWIRRASINDFRRMKEYGFNCPPTQIINYSSRQGGRVYLYNLKPYQSEWRAAGLGEPRIFALANFIRPLYRKYMGAQAKYYPSRYNSPMPPPEFFTELERLCREFKADCARQGLKNVYVLATDEPCLAAVELAKGIYRSLKKAGLRTFVTSCPVRRELAPYVDVWLDQSFDPLKTVLNSNKAEFWCYPNNQVYQFKDTPVMTRGGRMTYGFGLWRSGYTTLLPWMWSWNPKIPAPGIEFGGQRITPDGEVEIEWEWESIREGVIDGAYIYTLQEAIVRREPSRDARLQQLLRSGRALLQKIWDHIPPETQYLADNHWADHEFDSYRAELAAMIQQIKQYPECNQRRAPSILTNCRETATMPNVLDFLAAEERKGNISRQIIPDAAWRTNGEKEAHIATLPGGVIDFGIKVDYKFAGNPAGYKTGTPSLEAQFDRKIDLNAYSFIFYQLKVNSNRHIINNSKWPYTLLFFARQDASGERKLAELHPRTIIEPGIWQDNFYALSDLDLSPQWRREVYKFWLYFWERNFAHGDQLQIQIRNAALIKVKRPLVQTLAVPTRLAPAAEILWQAEIFGRITSPVAVKVRLKNAAGQVIAQKNEQIISNSAGGKLRPAQALTAGKYVLELQLHQQNKVWQSSAQTFELIRLF